MTESETANTLDPFVASDLATLATETRKNLPTLDESLETVEGGAYRDATAGAEARRDSLLAARRLELALMPLATGRIFVHRTARAAAGATAAIAAMFVVIIIADPMLLRLAGFFIPGLNLSVVAIGTLTAVLAVYLLATLIAERAFERRMRSSLETQGDAFDDIEALAHGPLDEARRLTRKLDGLSTALPLLGFAACAPLFAFLSLVFTPTLSRGVYTPTSLAFIQNDWVSSNLSFILLAILAGALLAIFIGRACHRQHHRIKDSILLAVLGHWAVIPAAIVFGLLVLVFIGSAITGVSVGHLPSAELRGFVAIGGSLAVFAPAAWLALFLRGSEEARLRRPDAA